MSHVATPLTNNGSHVNTTRGRKVTLYCGTTVSNSSRTIRDLYWTKNGVRLTSQPEVNSRTRVGGNVLFPDVNFDPVTPTDAGVYACVIVTEDDLVIGANLTLEVNCKSICKSSVSMCLVSTKVALPLSLFRSHLSSLSVCLCPSVSLSVSVSLSLSLCLSLSVSLSFLSLCFPVSLPIFLSLYLSVYIYLLILTLLKLMLL